MNYVENSIVHAAKVYNDKHKNSEDVIFRAAFIHVLFFSCIIFLLACKIIVMIAFLVWSLLFWSVCFFIKLIFPSSPCFVKNSLFFREPNQSSGIRNLRLEDLWLLRFLLLKDSYPLKIQHFLVHLEIIILLSCL